MTLIDYLSAMHCGVRNKASTDVGRQAGSAFVALGFYFLRLFLNQFIKIIVCRYTVAYKSLHAHSPSFRAAESRWNAQMTAIMNHGVENSLLPAEDDRTVPTRLTEAMDDEYRWGGVEEKWSNQRK